MVVKVTDIKWYYWLYSWLFVHLEVIYIKAWINVSGSMFCLSCGWKYTCSYGTCYGLACNRLC